VSLSRFHHRKVHQEAFRVLVLDSCAFRFVQPDSQAFDSIAKDMYIHHEQRGIVIDK
jgi:hypothetical protein